MVNKLVHLDDESETTTESSMVHNDFSLYACWHMLYVHMLYVVIISCSYACNY